jgi:hypothetical protein
MDDPFFLIYTLAVVCTLVIGYIAVVAKLIYDEQSGGRYEWPFLWFLYTDDVYGENQDVQKDEFQGDNRN